MSTSSTESRIPVWTLGDRLAKARRETGLTVAAFADLIGVSAKTVNNYESGAHAPRKIVLNAWSLATGVPSVWLRGGEAPVQSELDEGDWRARRYSKPQPSDPKVRGPYVRQGRRYFIA